MERPAKRTKLLSDSEGSEDEGVKLPKTKSSSSSTAGFKVNDDYAKRFEHNKKREDLQRLEEKYGNGKKAKFGARQEAFNPSDDDSSTGESEDDDANLVTEDLDNEIFATLQAIKTKDPRVYDANAKFFKEFDPEAAGAPAEKKEKPMTLHDYHRRNLMAGYTGGEDDEEEDDAPKTYSQEQDSLRREMVGQMHALAGAKEGEEEDEDDDFKPKAEGAHESLPAAKSSAKDKKRKARAITETDIAAAEKDPETYLSNFMAAQAWRPNEDSRPHAFDSDDSDEDKRADEFEEAYNMRFEDPAMANEKLQTFARDVAKYSVRRDEATGRQKAREREREKKEAVKRERDEERARLRKLKIEEAEQKVKRIREAAGLRGKDLDLQQWRDVIEGDFNDEEWDNEMKKRFGEDYYAEQEGNSYSDEEMPDAGSKKKKQKVRKPKWDDDIDIKDLVPDFVEDDHEAAGKYTLSDDDEEGGAPLDNNSGTEEPAPKRKTKKDRLQEKSDAKRAARKDRRAIEDIVDASLLPATSSSKGSSRFRYRETSPTSFGLSARDILFADDAALNQFAGLKKMATWRDAERKARDRKKMSKKGRLRMWRKETFGSAEEPVGGFEVVLGKDGGAGEGFVGGNEKKEEGNVKEGERKKRKRKGKKAKADGVES